VAAAQHGSKKEKNSGRFGRESFFILSARAIEGKFSLTLSLTIWPKSIFGFTKVKNTVGPRCVVVWRNRTQGIHKMGGAHHFYDGKERIGPDRQVPIIDCGIDVAAIVKTMMPATMAAFLATGSLAIDMDKMNAKITKLPDKSDERLR
jgi:hypothetical protein